MLFLRAALGVAFFCFVSWLLSKHRRRFPWRVVVFGIGLQLAFAGLILGTAGGRALFEGAGRFFLELVSKSEPGARLVFGPLADTQALDGVFGPGSGYVFAFTASGLLAVIFFAALMSILYHLGIMQAVVWVAARVMAVTMGVSGAESMAIAANIFAGQTEAPLVVRPYIARMTESELNALMTGGFATIAGTVLAAYMNFVGPELAPHLLTASVMSAPAAFLIAKIMIPETGVSQTAGRIPLRVERTASNVIEAAANGTQDGIKLALNIAGMLIAFMALVNLANWPLEGLGEALALEGGLSLSRLFGWVLAPVAWLMGVEGWHDTQMVGSLLGTKVAINEFVGYSEMGLILNGEGGRAPFEHARSSVIAAYALCGFANFASIGIQIGGISPLAPERKADLARLAPRAMLGGAFASWTTATVAGLFL
jgi:CNT family concentrative nucleoside transporter